MFGLVLATRGWGGGGEKKLQFYNTTGTEKYSITVLFTIYYLISKNIQKAILGTV